MGGAPSPYIVQGLLCSVTRSRALQACSDSLSDPRFGGGISWLSPRYSVYSEEYRGTKGKTAELTPVGLQNDNKTKSKWRDFMARRVPRQGSSRALPCP